MRYQTAVLEVISILRFFSPYHSKQSLAALRRQASLPAGAKVLVVLDRFEQWLHAKRKDGDDQLVYALRQCDGERVQCLVLVRDDFWMAATRFMGALEISLVHGQNSAAVDLFDVDHARKVLSAFGRAFGKLPEDPADTSKEQNDFLTQCVAGLAQDGRVISVRLALFAEMIKGRPWTRATLKEMGGAGGVGVAFLEDTLSSTMAPPEHRLHQRAAHPFSYDNILSGLGIIVTAVYTIKKVWIKYPMPGTHVARGGDEWFLFKPEIGLSQWNCTGFDAECLAYTRRLVCIDVPYNPLAVWILELRHHLAYRIRVRNNLVSQEENEIIIL